MVEAMGGRLRAVEVMTLEVNARLCMILNKTLS